MSRTLTPVDPIVEAALDDTRRVIERAASEAFEAGLAASSGKMLTTARAADELGLSRTFVYKLARSHGLGRRVGRSVMLTPSEVEVLRNRRGARGGRGGAPARP